MLPWKRPLLAGMLSVAILPALLGQDARTVTEPHVPATCQRLTAELRAPQGQLDASDESRLDTARIQQALDRCPAGHAVVLEAAGVRNVFLTGPLALRSGVTLVISSGTVLAASRDPRQFDLHPGSCGILNDKGHGCKPLLSGQNIHDAGLMGAGAIDGRGGSVVLGQQETWWQMAHRAKIEDRHQNNPWLVTLDHVQNFTLYQITLRNSPGFHVAVNNADGFTAWGVKIRTPKTARNTDGIDPGSSKNVTIAYTSIATGDDDVAVKSGSSGPAENISVLHSHFYSGHGMSIGSGTSGGVRHMLVDDLSIDGADNGLRIKSDPSRGGLVEDVTYRNVCIRDTLNPLLFTPHYTNASGDALPVYRNITLDGVHVISAGTYTFAGLDATHPLEIALRNVTLDEQSHSTFLDSFAHFHTTATNYQPSGNGISVDNESSTAQPVDCRNRFPALEPISTAPELAGLTPPEDHTFYVAADGTGEYYSIQRAVDAAPETGALILVAPGTYRERVTIGKSHIQLRSANPDPTQTVIVNDASAGSTGSTFRSATVSVTGDDFFAENITIENDFNRTHPQLPSGSQALALSITADRARLHHVHLLANQDTVYLATAHCGPDGPNCKPTRQYFSDCLIAGNVDFIFGDSKAYFERCELRSTAHAGGYLTAQSKHYAEQDSGFVFNHCTTTADPEAKAPIYLGRPWRPYSKVIFLNSNIGAHIDPAGWREWHPGETHSLDTSYYAEFNSTGSSATPAERDPHTHQLNATEAALFSVEAFLSGADHWTPATDPIPPIQ